MTLGLHGLVCCAARIPAANPHLAFNEYRDRVMKYGRAPVNMNSGTCPKAASVNSSGAEFSEEFVGSKMKEKKKTRTSVAGIDQDELVDPAMLADPDSCFYEFKGVQIHHKICTAEEEQTQVVPNKIEGIGLGFPMILLHGFGASVFSWERMMKPLARITGMKVLAFDRPAFGLTSRVFAHINSKSASEDTKLLNPYSMAFAVLATLSFIDFLHAEKAVLMGHSAGCLVAVNTYFEAPERVAALILVAPAIVAPLISHKATKGNQKRREKEAEDESCSNPDVKQNPFILIRMIISELCMHIARATMQMLRRMMDTISSLYKKVLSAILRSSFFVMLVRIIMDKLGIAAVRNAWHDATQVTEHVLHGYTKPLRSKDWDKALIEYTLAMLTDSNLPLKKSLPKISCPVLIVTGDRDRLVPAWNAERLSQAIPGSYFEVIKNCGHLPHEEKVEEFLLIVDNFLRRVFRIPEELLLQAPS